MAKVLGPLFSTDARGKIANSLVFLGWRGLKTVRRYLIPANPRTAGQQAIRNLFTANVNGWHSLAAENATAWGRRASGQAYSGFNRFMGLYTAAAHAGLVVEYLADLAVAATANPGELQVTATTTASMKLRVRAGSSPGTFTDETLEGLAGTAHTVLLTGLTSGVLYYIQVDQDIADTTNFATSGWNIATPS